MNHLDFLRLFHPISSEEYELLTEQVHSRKAKKGENLVVPGQVQRELYFIRSGVQMSYFDGAGQPLVIAFTYCPNLCAIPESFSGQVPSPYFLSCLTDSEMDCLSYERLQTVFDRSQNLERLFRKMTEAMLSGIINRHIELHTLSIEQRYRQFCERSAHLLQLVPHKYIASYLGIDPSNFSKLYNSVKI